MRLRINFFMRQKLLAMVVQSQSFTDPAGYGARLLAFDQFNPAMGTLAGIRLETSVQLAGSLWVENLEGRAVSLTYAPKAHVSVFSPGGVKLDALSAAGEATITLAAFDGGVDYAGDSGTSLVVSASVDGVAGTAPGGTIEHLPFIGTGSVALPVSDYATNRIAGPANMRVRAAAAVEGTVRLAYDYTPNVEAVDTDTGGGVVITIGNPPWEVIRPVTVTTAPQVFRFDPRASGWQETLGIARFDPLLGTLSAVHIRLVSSVQVSAGIENHGTAGGSAEISQHAFTVLALDGSALASSAAEMRRSLAFGAVDGVDDFAGTGGMGDAGTAMTTAQAVTLGGTADLATFTGDGSVDLLLDSQGTGEIAGPASFLAEIAALSGALVEVAYTYIVQAAASAVLVEDGSGTSTRVNAEAYAGLVPNLQHQFITITPDNLVIAATTDNWFIRTGDGTDAIAARGGTNVIDGGGGSNFLSGGFAKDTFFVDLRDPAHDVWSTVANFQAGDEVTLWGVTAENMQFSWVDGAGAVGATGLTLHAVAAAQPTGSLTLTGYGTGDLTNGRLVTSFGTVGGNDYLFIRAV